MSRKRSIRARILVGYLTLIGAAFLAVFIVFNIAVQEYIVESAEQEVHRATQMARDNPKDRVGAGGAGFPHNRRMPDSIGMEARAFFWDGTEATWDASQLGWEHEAEIAEKVDLARALEEVQTVTTDDGTFLVFAMQVTPGAGDEERFLILYVDVTEMQSFARNINVMLIVILLSVGAAAVFAAFGLSGSIVRPFRQLSEFAGKLGENDFTRSTLSFRDREPAELLEVMNQTADKLREYDRDQKTFFQNVSHELKTPLMTIRCNAEGVAFRVMDPDQSAATIMKETDRLGEMIDDVLYISRMDTLTESEVLAECDVREILSNCVESQRLAAERRGLRIVCDFADEPVMSRVSEKSLQRALSNLVSNAIRYAKNEVVMTCVAQNEHTIVSVCNDGPEIAGEDLPHIFERFYKGAGGQSGIGLSIVRSVIEKLGGRISVKTGPDVTCFTAEF